MAVALYLGFLRESQVDGLSSAGLSAPSLSIADVVSRTFSLLSDRHLRGLIGAALAFRDQRVSGVEGGALEAVNEKELLGDWGAVIDAIKEVTMLKRESATANFQSMVAVGREGDPKRVSSELARLFKGGEVDFLFMDILQEAHKTCLKGGRAQEDSAAMFQFFLDVVEKLRRVTKAAVAASGAEAAADEVKDPEARVAVEEDSEEEDEPNTGVDDEARTAQLVRAGDFLHSLVQDSAGDVLGLKQRLLHALGSGAVGGKELREVLRDNIAACRLANYATKLRLFEFVLRLVESYEDEQAVPLASGDSNLADQYTNYHSPKFVDGSTTQDSAASALPVAAPGAFIDGCGTSNALLLKDVNTKKKAQKKALRARAVDTAGRVGSHLSQHGWAVCDNFLPPDVVRRVRIEASLFKQHYEQSEIWVGKAADVGAHLQVPSVRGDKVLWICGAHNGAPEGQQSRVVKTTGELEPCKMEVKAASHLRKFAGLKEVVAAVDAFMDELKLQVPHLSGVYERSDAMLAIYPGGGARFARHIDNTTGDGRRVTALVYLNPGWARDMGGALRLTPPARVAGCCDTASLAASEGVVDVYPDAGRLVLFYSSEVPHEVLPTFGERHALTLWYYDSQERAAALNESKQAGRGLAVHRAGAGAQQEAKAFIGRLMGGDDVGEDGGAPISEDLAALATAAAALSEEALGIVASITGAPSAASFRQGFALLVPEDLKSMRRLFRRMGIN